MSRKPDKACCFQEKSCEKNAQKCLLCSCSSKSNGDGRSWLPSVPFNIFALPFDPLVELNVPLSKRKACATHLDLDRRIRTAYLPRLEAKFDSSLPEQRKLIFELRKQFEEHVSAAAKAAGVQVPDKFEVVTDQANWIAFSKARADSSASDSSTTSSSSSPSTSSSSQSQSPPSSQSSSGQASVPSSPSSSTVLPLSSSSSAVATSVSSFSEAASSADYLYRVSGGQPTHALLQLPVPPSSAAPPSGLILPASGADASALMSQPSSFPMPVRMDCVVQDPLQLAKMVGTARAASAVAVQASLPGGASVTSLFQAGVPQPDLFDELLKLRSCMYDTFLLLSISFIIFLLFSV